VLLNVIKFQFNMIVLCDTDMLCLHDACDGASNMRAN